MRHFALVLLGTAAGAVPVAAADPSFTKDVQPFVQKYCTECHNAQKAKAGVVLDSFDAMLKAGKKGAPVVPGKPEKSSLYLTMTGGGKQMPPRKFPDKPTKDEIAVIKAWIAAGAKDDTPAK